MTRDVALEELREHLDEIVDEVRQGTTIRVIEGGRELASIAPFTDVPVIARPATKRWSDIQLPPSADPEIDVVKYLLEDRGR
jgi:antitoxin (DNA-binding transcriptional repressor) of toxin-antitoxin stability system